VNGSLLIALDLRRRHGVPCAFIVAHSAVSIGSSADSLSL